MCFLFKINLLFDDISVNDETEWIKSLISLNNNSSNPITSIFIQLLLSAHNYS
jgi:hypothetical protein